jgi:predicted metal-dependent peptidase
MDLLEIEESDQIPTACTNGRKITVNPKFFKKLNNLERVYVICHEVTHVILQHPDRMRLYHEMGYGPDLTPFSSKRFNIAADYVINAYLNELKIGAQPVGSLLNGQFSSLDLVDDVYLKIPEDEDDSGNWDQHAPSDPNAPSPSKAAIQRAVAGAAVAAKGMGKLPGGLQRLIDEILDPQVKWTELIRSAITTCVGNTENTWARPNRRRLASPPHVYWPGRAGIQTGQLALEIDTSGSIGERELQTFLSEVHGILSDVMPEKIHVMYVDSKLYNDEVIEIDDPNDILELGKKAGGGGGTDMTVVFDEIEKRQLAVEYAIILTDGCCNFGEDRGIPTIWCITTPGVESPWGINVHVEIK